MSIPRIIQDSNSSEEHDKVDFTKITTKAEILAAIAQGLDPNALNYDGFAPLHLAQNEEVARALVGAGSRVKRRVTSENGEYHRSTPLHMARDADVAQYLINRGASVEAEDHRGRTPLFCASTTAVLNVLIQSGADIEAVDEDGNTPIFAVKDVEQTRALVENGAYLEHWRPNCVDDDFWGTPLMSRVDNEDIALLLIESGADINAHTGDNGPPPFADKGSSALRRHIKAGNVRVVQEMVRRGVIVGYDDLHSAADRSSDEILRILIGGGTSVGVKSKDGKTVLHTTDNHTQFLLSIGADVTARDDEGNTPLHTSFAEEFALMTENWADIEAVNEEGETPLHVTCKRATVLQNAPWMYEK